MMTSAWSLLRSPDAVKAREWFRWHPSDIDACIEARSAQPPPPLAHDELAELAGGHERWRADESSFANVELLGEAGTQVVVAGQQPGLLAGPMYTIYKAAGAVLLARELQNRHPGRKFVPVFWVAGEDDDFDEIRTACWPGAQGGLIDFQLDGTLHKPGGMIGLMAASPWDHDIEASIRHSTHATERREAALSLLRAAHDDAANFEDAFCRLLLSFFKGTGLVIVSPLMKWVRRRGADVIRREIKTAGHSTRLLLNQAEKLKLAGMDAPIHRHKDAINAFRLDGAGCRHGLRWQDDHIAVMPLTGDSSPERLSRSSLLHELEDSPEAFAYNVVARTVIQDTILPTVAQMIGPGEAAYLAQLEVVYEHFEALPPVRWPRPQAVIVTSQAARALSKAGISTEEAINLDAREIIRRKIEEGSGADSLKALDNLRERHLRDIQELGLAFGSSPTLQSSVSKLYDGTLKGFSMLRERLVQSTEAGQATLRDSIDRAVQSLRPKNEPQERILNPVIPFTAALGPDWVGSLLAHLDHAWDAELQIIQQNDLETKP